MKHVRWSRRWQQALGAFTIAGALLFGLGGCAAMQADSTAPAQIDSRQVRLADDIKAEHVGWPQAQWWQHYADPQLDALITRALQDSPAMAVAKARVEAGQAQARAVDASTGLLVGLTASLDREHVSAGGFGRAFATTNPMLGATGPWYTTATVGLGAEYSVDLWGRDRARVNAAIGASRAHEAEAAQVRLLLSAQVAHAYYDMQTAFAVKALLEQARAIEQEAIDAHHARAGRGLEPETLAQISLAHRLELDQKINATQVRIRMLREVLRALSGAGPDGLVEIKPMVLPAVSAELPSSLGYELLARRPDLQAMHLYVAASLDQIEAAKAAFYPSFDIKAFFGFDALHLEDLLRRSSRQINLIPGLSLPIFDSGRLNANLAASRSQRNVLVAEYNQSVLNAVREVAQSAIELEGLGQQAAMEQQQIQSVSFASDSAQAHFERGLVDKVAALEAKLPVLLEQGKLLELQSRQIHTQISLSTALGGGYDSRSQGASTER